MPGRDNLAALLMTLGVTATLLLPLVWVMFTVASDVAAASAVLRQFAVHGLPPLPAGVALPLSYRGWRRFYAGCREGGEESLLLINYWH